MALRNITTISFLLLALVGGAFVFFKNKQRNGKKNKNCRLSARIDEELKKSKKDLLVENFKSFITQLYRPTRASVLVFIGAFVALFLLARLPDSSTPLSFDTSNHYQNLIAILGGIGTVVFALMIFVAESLRDSADRAKILLKQSWLYPLTVISIFSLVIFVWWDVGLWSVIIILVAAGLTIFAVYQVFKLLLSKALFSKKEQEFWRDRVKSSIGDALKLRIGNNIYLKTLEDGNFNLEFSFWREERETLKDFKLKRIGVIKDIDLCRLSELEDFLEQLANKHDKSFKLSKEAKSVDKRSLESGSEYVETKTKEEKPIKGYLYKKLGDDLDGEHQEALSIPSDICSEEDNKVIQDKLEDIYIIGGKPGESLREELRLELSGKKDAAVWAIREGKTGQLEEISDLYVALAESFLEVMKGVGGGYSWEQARKERGAIIGGWDEVRWISKDLYDLLFEAVLSEHRRTVSILSYAPISIAIRSIKYSDHFVFQEFVPFQQQLYRLSEKVKDPDIKHDLFDSSWRHLKEMGDFYIASQLDKKETTLEELESLKYYAIDIFKVFLGLLKQSFDKNKLNDFQQFQKAAIKLFDHFKPSEENLNAWHYDLLLKNTNLSEEERAKYQRGKERQELLEGVEKELKKRKTQMLFGMGAWIFYRLQSKDFDDNDMLQFWGSVKNALPGSLEELTEVYQELHTFGSEQFWGWDWWEIEEKGGEGEAVWMDVGGKIDWLYAARAIELLGGLSDEQIKSSKIEVNRDFVYLIENDNSPARSKLVGIKANPQKWNKLLSDEAIKKIDALLGLFDSKVQEQNKKEEDFLATTGISKSKVDRFFSGFTTGFNASTTVRKLFKLSGSYKELHRRVKNKATFWGFNQINDKAAFIDDWHVQYSEWGKHYGEELGSEEDRRLYREISAGLPATSGDLVSIGKTLATAISKIKGERSRYLVVFTTMFIGDFSREKKDDFEFIPRYTVDNKRYGRIPGFVGQFKIKGKIIPVFEAGVRDNRNELCLIDPKRIGEFIQYLPYEDEGQKQFRRENFLFQVIDLNADEKTRKDIVKKNPDWLQQHTDPEFYLKQKVIIKLLERFEFRFGDKKAGIKIVTPNGDAV
jgi:hypothetical protein